MRPLPRRRPPGGRAQRRGVRRPGPQTRQATASPRLLRPAGAARADRDGVRPGRRTVRAAPARRRGRGPRPPAPQGRAVRRRPVRRLQDGLLRRTRRTDRHQRGREHRRIMVFAGPDIVVTVRHGRHGSLGPLREDLEAEPEQLAKGPAAVLHAIADHVVDDYLTVTDAVQNDIDQVETDVFSPEGSKGADAGRIHQLKRELLELERAVVPPRPSPPGARHPIDARHRPRDTGVLP
ncbi:CorA family divalent cation transporter [Streptomyces mirabilis]|uniref:CorA family divalent cation transporter n=1 Tax=Streptomyces mirabilis TaxID=68239 RepID=UPI0036C74089